MTDPMPFALAVLLIGGVGLAAVLANRLTTWLFVPAPALVFLASAIAVDVVPDLHTPPHQAVERIVTVGLVCILFDGGMHIGLQRFRHAAGPIVVVGVLGTFLTVAGMAVLLNVATGLDWYAAVLVATAVAPTDPAVVFSVFGNREVSGRGATILEGESGANDPVGIALMASLISAGGLSGPAFGHVAGEFALQMAVGLAVGGAGGVALRWFTRQVALPREGLYPLRTLACALVLFGAATLAHGSGFLAVFVAGIVVGDATTPYKQEIARFHSALASLGEIAAFVALGLTVDLHVLARSDVWLDGLLLGGALAFVVRPVLVGPCLLGSRLGRRERAFVLFGGLKGAVPILLGTMLVASRISGASRLFGIVVVVVLFSVLVQGGLLPAAARWLRIPMRTVEPEPWSLGVRLRDEPVAVHRLTVQDGSSADGRNLDELVDGSVLPGNARVSLVVRDGRLLPFEATPLRAGDVAIVLADPDLGVRLTAIFQAPFNTIT